MVKGTQKRKLALGRWGETAAAAYLEEKGYVIIEKNIRTPYGEIDILAKHQDQLIFVEVKTRSSKRFGEPEAAVTEEKITHMIDSAQSYLQEHPEVNQDWRIDVIAILQVRGEQPVITHFENAV